MMRPELIKHDGLVHHVRHVWTVAYATGCFIEINRPDNIGHPQLIKTGAVTCLRCIREAQAMEEEDEFSRLRR